VSDPEWTILSGLGRPELCGGIGVITAALDGWRERLDLEKLVRYTHYMRNMTAARRLGYLLERLGMHTEQTRMRLSIQVRTSYGRLDPGRPWKGDLERKWRVDVNSIGGLGTVM
jgi:predicted transcriptional regulator of viral defense system